MKLAEAIESLEYTPTAVSLVDIGRMVFGMLSKLNTAVFHNAYCKPRPLSCLWLIDFRIDRFALSGLLK